MDRLLDVAVLVRVLDVVLLLVVPPLAVHRVLEHLVAPAVAHPVALVLPPAAERRPRPEPVLPLARLPELPLEFLELLGSAVEPPRVRRIASRSLPDRI